MTDTSESVARDAIETLAEFLAVADGSQWGAPGMRHFTLARALVVEGYRKDEGMARDARSVSCADATGRDVEGVEILVIGGKPCAIDASIAPLVRALNDAGLRTVACCSGHGQRPGSVVLSDGRELVITRNYREARVIDRKFPGVNGEQSLHVRAYEYAEQFRAYLDAGGKLTLPPVEGLIEFIMNLTGRGADDV